MTDQPVVLTLNAGSSSLKFGVFTVAETPVAKTLGLVEAIGTAPVLRLSCGAGRALRPDEAADHSGALATVLDSLGDALPGVGVVAVGHRVVHGGPDLAGPRVVDDAVMEEIRRLAPFAPLHQPHNIAGIEAAARAFPDAVQVACFDTAFHRAQPRLNDLYALPRRYYDKGVRRYGFHGLSYAHIAEVLRNEAPELHAGRLIVAHLGNGASMCGMIGGRSVASTMGFTALDGLAMGTRTGQIDPGVILYLMQQEGLSVEEVSRLLYTGSGLLGLSGLSNDLRVLEAAGTPEADEAIAYFVARIRREIGSLAAALGGVDALVFCGGIGEHSARVRGAVCDGMGWLGMEPDHARNRAHGPVISTPDSRVRILVIPANEELVIARAAAARVGARR